MVVNLDSIGMEKGLQYETIITTENEKNEKNSAPIGIICKGKNKVMCRIFEGSKTLDNIRNRKRFVVNITLNPILFTFATIDNVPNEYFTDEDIAILKESEAYLKCDVIEIKEGIKHNDPIKQDKAGIILAEVKEIVKNKECVKSPNRGFYSLIESLVNFTRIDIVNKEQQDYFLDRFKESKRIINKVGSEQEKEAMLFIQKALKNKEYEIPLDK